MPCGSKDYALIGDCETAALVGRDGSIDWLCWPRFDSDACFAALLGDSRHGRWRIAHATASGMSHAAIAGNTSFSKRRSRTSDGVVTVIDFMPFGDGISDIVRLVKGVVSGSVTLCMELIVRFGYGRSSVGYAP